MSTGIVIVTIMNNFEEEFLHLLYSLLIFCALNSCTCLATIRVYSILWFKLYLTLLQTHYDFKIVHCHTWFIFVPILLV